MLKHLIGLVSFEQTDAWYAARWVAADIDVCAAVIPLIPQSPWYLDNARP